MSHFKMFRWLTASYVDIHAVAKDGLPSNARDPTAPTA